MKIAAVGKGNVGGGLADLWEKAGHEVTRIGQENGCRAGSRTGRSPARRGTVF